MAHSLELPKYSIGVGDRFAHQAKAQLEACVKASESGVDVTPVWNKSNREHNIVGPDPSGTRAAADAAVKSLNWNKPYFLDADHINLNTVARFIEPCDFFTLDVADLIGKPADAASVNQFLNENSELIGSLDIPGVDRTIQVDREFANQVADKDLAAVQDAGRIYRHLENAKGKGNFVPEVSMDETDAPQTPAELLIILARLLTKLFRSIQLLRSSRAVSTKESITLAI